VRAASLQPVEVFAIEGLAEVRPGDDLVDVLAPALTAAGVRDGDIVVVTSKIVSKAEGRLVADVDRAATIDAESVRVVARRDDLIIAETAHGFVCANAGVDASNVDAGWLALLPTDPDASARALRTGLSSRLGSDLAVVITDTFGRAWRTGVVNVAIGCDGLPSVVDLRGRADDRGATLVATEVALADEVAAASGLVMAKHARLPVAVVRGVDRMGGADGPARDLVRPANEDLFRRSPLQALVDHHAARAFASGDVETAALERAIAAACTAAVLLPTDDWRFSVLRSEAARRSYLASIGAERHSDDGGRDAGAVLRAAPVLIAPWCSLAGQRAPGQEGAEAERNTVVLSAGAAIQTLLLALSAQGLASRWVGPSIASSDEARAAFGLDDEWLALGTVACGPAPAERPSSRTAPDDPAIVDYR
jgi:coenzyme F420-0:L-glutamate ligase / coenzyme F420-1:gamma-L-glutamate ligase